MYLRVPLEVGNLLDGDLDSQKGLCSMELVQVRHPLQRAHLTEKVAATFPSVGLQE
jgi:hypothetical protein